MKRCLFLALSSHHSNPLREITSASACAYHLYIHVWMHVCMYIYGSWEHTMFCTLHFSWTVFWRLMGIHLPPSALSEWNRLSLMWLRRIPECYTEVGGWVLVNVERRFILSENCKVPSQIPWYLKCLLADKHLRGKEVGHRLTFQLGS